MIIRLIVHRLVQWKWMWIIPAVTAPVLALVLLLFVDPAYVSTCRLWVKERAEGSELLKIQRLGQQQNTYVEVQREIFSSNPVLEDVVRRGNLSAPPPRQSIFSRLTGLGRHPGAIAEIDATDDLRERVWVEVVNPEIIVVGCRMNTPELAQSTLNELVESYRRQYLNILNFEVNEYKRFLEEALRGLIGGVAVLEQDLEEFESAHPDTATQPPLVSESLLRGSPEIGLVREVNDVSPVPLVLQELARLELELNQAEIRFAPASTRVRQLNRQITKNRELLEGYMAELSESARLAVKHEAIKWRLQEARRQYTSINSEYHRILITEGTKLKQTSSITMLNLPTFEPEQISPRKKVTLFASLVLGFFFGFALFYLRFLMDRTYCLPEEVEQDLGLPVLAVVPLAPQPEPDRLDRLCLNSFRLLRRIIPPYRRKP